MTKVVMICYNEAVDDDVMGILAHCPIKNYTKLTGIYGRGETSGTHLGNDIWPGLNNILYVACDSAQASEMLDSVKELRKRLGSEGIKAFVLPVEAMT